MRLVNLLYTYFGLVSKELDPNVEFSTGESISYSLGAQGSRYIGYEKQRNFRRYPNINDSVTFVLDLQLKQWKFQYYDKEIQQNVECKIFDVQVSDDRVHTNLC